jgi:C1A family cysteine protease
MPLIRKIIIFPIIFLAALTGVLAQGMGAIFDEEAYGNLPRRAELAALSYEGLPSSFSLKQYAPLPGDQADYGTCVAWAAAYAARTICESVALNRVNQTETTQNVFSPVYVYRNIRPDDPECIRGAQIYSALDLMRDTGAVKMLEVERDMAFPRVDLAYYRTSRNYPIADYITLFSRDDRQKPALITRIVKKSLTEGKPVIIGINTPDSFIEAKDVWRPNEDPRYSYYGHALCVVGYDDNRSGGAFEVMNSWGRKWGNGGYIWIPYEVFVAFVTEGYEIIENIANYSDSIKFEGFVRLEVVGQESVEFALRDRVYTATGTYTEGTQFRYTVGSRESAYVYSFSVSQPLGDSRFYAPVLLFPQPGISALLNYSDSSVILPGGNTTLVMGAAGTEYLITLYAKHALDINSIMRRFQTTEGTLNKRLAAAVGDGLMTVLSFSENEAAFTAEPDNPRIITALITTVEHR